MSIPDSSSQKGIAQPNPQEAVIKAANARRVAQRAGYASLAAAIQQTDFDALRRDPKRKIGGTFEALQKIPKRKADKASGVKQKDINDFLAAFSFQNMTDITPRQDRVVGASTGGANNVGTRAIASAQNRVASSTTLHFDPTRGWY